MFFFSKKKVISIMRYLLSSNNLLYLSSFVDVCARTEDPWARVRVPPAHRARSSNNGHQDPESSLNLKKWEDIYMDIYGHIWTDPYHYFQESRIQAHRARSSNNRHQDPESSLNLEKWKDIFGYISG